MLGLTAKLLSGDCAQIMKQIPDVSVDLTVTSPPYDGLRIYNGYSFDFEETAKELYRVTKIGGVVVWVVGDQTKDGSESGTSFRQALFFKEVGFKLHDTMIYQSEKPPLTHNRYEQKFEYMFVMCKGKLRCFNPLTEPCKYAGQSPWGKQSHRHTGTELSEAHSKGAPTKDVKYRGNIWKYATGFSKSTKDKSAFKHPAIFPEKLAEDHIISWSNPGDTILDPFLGSGTTGKMAVLNKRNFIGIEISPEYLKLARERIKAAVVELQAQ